MLFKKREKIEDKKENKIPSFLAFAKIEHESSFLDGLLKKQFKTK